MKSKMLLFIGALVLCFAALLCIMPAIADTAQDYIVAGKDYVLPEDSNFDYSKVSSSDRFFYGSQSLGTLHIQGAIQKKTVYNGYPAYGATDSLSVLYTYYGIYQEKTKEAWHIENDGTRWIRDYDLGFLNNIAKGCIMIEKSPDGNKWEKVIDPIKNYFDKAKSTAESLILTIPEDDYKNGMYYRVVAAYKFAKRAKPAFLGDEYDRRKCVEVYEFYVASERNYVTVRDMGNGSNLRNQAATDSGFMIRLNGSKAKVSVRDIKESCQDFDYFTDPGEYTIDVTTKLGKQYTYNISVTDGLGLYPIVQKIYESDNDKGYPLTKLYSTPSSGSSLTSLYLAVPKSVEVKQKESKYGVKATKSVAFYLKLNRKDGNLGNGWELSSDTWGGAKNRELVNGVETGPVGKGALIVQTSGDGKTWENVDKGRYANGLYTTDYATHYGKAETVLIYTPYGNDVLKGMHVRVLFAYELFNKSTNQFRNVLETYQCYLCSDELGAVTFHNLSVADSLDETFADADQNTVEVYKKAETLEDGGYAASGFRIDKNLNPTVSHTVLRNGNKVNDNQNTYEEAGRYDITLTSAVGSTREITLYVDRSGPEEAMKQYFDEGFISGKRIFSEGEYPVYEGGVTSYHVAAADNNTLPLYGQITNLTTGSVITIEQTAEKKTGVLSEPGEYQAVFATSEKAFTGELTGDARVFTFRFLIIAEGTAPGPVINRKMLDDYSHSTVTDSNPVYYGLTFSSAGKGHITLAFASKEEANKDAYQYEKGTVEQQENGEYRYTGSIHVDQKSKFDSVWELTDNVNISSEAAVRQHYFDMSDEFTYLSLSEEVLTQNNNLRQLELPRSVTVFAKGQKEKLTDIDALPLLNDKPYAYLNPEKNEEERGTYSFEFVTDQYGGIDSKTVMITDSNGGQHAIRYSESVGQQLLADNCPSGIVTIREETMYGDSAEYQAVYIAPGENQTKLVLSYTQGNDSETAVYEGSAEGPDIVADSFTIADVSDPLDPYALVVVKHYQNEDAFTAKDKIDKVWSDPGEYKITCVNRMGYGYTVPITVNGEVDPAAAWNKPEETAEPVAQAAQNTSDTSTEGTETEQSQQVAVSEQDEEVRTTDKPADPKEKETIAEQKTENNNGSVIVIGVIAGLLLIAALIAFIYRRGKLYSRMADTIKSEEENKHE